MTSCGSASTAFHAERKALIAEERARGHHHRSRTLSAKEGKAIEIIQQLRQAEYETLWNETTGAFHSMPFTSAKTVIGQSKLFALLQQVKSYTFLAVLRIQTGTDPGSCLGAPKDA